ncbi:hypothetical protein TL16_g11322, partial [Triparma laevis f. inornata]
LLPLPTSLRSTSSQNSTSSQTSISSSPTGLLLLRTASLLNSVRGPNLPNPLAGLLKPGEYTCQICYGVFERGEEEYDPYVLSNCGHCFCKPCLFSYIKTSVTDGQISLTCFYRTETYTPTGKSTDQVCSATFGERDVRDILTPNGSSISVSSRNQNFESSNSNSKVENLEGEEVYKKYERFKFDRDNADARRCPKCDLGIINKSGRKDGKIVNPEMKCTSCNTSFCFYHSNSHPGIRCAEYEKLNSKENKLNQAYLSKFSKPCPQCKASVQKSGGCNQMKCTNCGVHFCWLCNKQVDGGTFPSHFQWWNVNGCPNMQMNESIEPTKGEIGRSRGLAVLQIAVLGVPSALLTLASSIVCCCCLPAMGDDASERFESCMSLWGNLLSVLIMVPVILVGLAIVPVWCIFYTVFFCLKNFLCGIGDGEGGDKEKEKDLSEDDVLVEMEEGYNNELKTF